MNESPGQNESPLKTLLHTAHQELNARFTNFHGWLMPVHYRKGIIEEHLSVRNSAGLFDLCHMGQIECGGPDAGAFLQKVITNDIGKVNDGGALYSPVCNDRGGILEDLIIYRFSDQHYFLIVNASNRLKDYDWLTAHARNFSVRIRDTSDARALIALQGPVSEESLYSIGCTAAKRMRNFEFSEARIAGIDVFLARTGYTGEDGFEISIPKEHCETVWRSILTEAKPEPVPVGLGARDTLRIEARYPLYGNDIDDEHSPLEAGLGWTVCLEKDDFIGKSALDDQAKNGVMRKLVGFEMIDPGIPRQHCLLKVNGSPVGVVTSGTFSPVLQKTIGLGYVPVENSRTGAEIDVEIRGKDRRAIVVRTPFYQGGLYAKRKEAER